MPDGIPLSGTRLYDVLPSSVRDDPVFMALASRLDGTLAEEDANHPLVLVWARIDRAEEPLLSNLAYQHRDRDRYSAIEDAARRNGRGFWPTLWRTEK